MLPLLALIPGLLWTGAKFVGPILESHSSQLLPLLTNILSNSPTGKKIVAAFESVMGSIDEQKKQEFTLELDSMLGQIELDKQESISESSFKSCWRPFIAWGMGINIVLHYTIVNMIDIVSTLFHTQINQVPQMDNMALAIISGLLGLYMVARSADKRIQSQPDDTDS